MEELERFLNWKVNWEEGMFSILFIIIVESTFIDQYEDQLIHCIFAFSKYNQEKRVLFAKKFISDILSIQTKSICNTILKVDYIVCLFIFSSILKLVIQKDVFLQEGQ